jgi:hypothetical protein
MLLSLSHKFIFIANLKSASSTIESALGERAEVRITQTMFGKHDGLSAISQKFSWVRRYVPFGEFFVFGVIRDPVDYLLSLYNSHQKPDFDGRRYSTKGIEFDDFLENWCIRSWQSKPQHLRFKDKHGRFRVDHLILLEHLGREFPEVCGRLGIEPVELERMNSSPAMLKRADLTSDQIEKIKLRYEDDYNLIRDRPRCL